MAEKISDVLKKAIERQNQITDANILKKRNYSPQAEKEKDLENQSKFKWTFIELAEIANKELMSQRLKDQFSSKARTDKSFFLDPNTLDLPPVLPPEFIFLHDMIFTEGEIVVDAILDQDDPKKWWEISKNSYLEDASEFDQGFLTPEERCYDLIKEWKENEAISDD